MSDLDELDGEDLRDRVVSEGECPNCVIKAAQIDSLRAELNEHSKCIQADQLAMARRENELYDEKDKQIAVLQAEVERQQLRYECVTVAANKANEALAPLLALARAASAYLDRITAKKNSLTTKLCRTCGHAIFTQATSDALVEFVSALGAVQRALPACRQYSGSH